MDAFLAKYMAVPSRLRYPAAAALLVIMVGLYIFGVNSAQAAALAALAAEATKLETVKVEKQIYAKDLPKYEARYSSLQESLTTARSMLPDNADVPQFLAQIGNKARDMGLIIDRVEPKDETYSDFYAEIGFSMQVRGSYHEIGMFIDQVGRMDRIVTVSDLTMATPKSESKKIILNGAFQVKTYRFLTDEQLRELETTRKKEGKK